MNASASQYSRATVGWGAGIGLLALAAIAAAPSHPESRTATSPARVWLGGDVQMDGRTRNVLTAIPALVAHAPGIVNLEGPIARASAAPARRTSSLQVLNAPMVVGELRAAGIRVAGIANNHAGDAGPGGVATTARALREGGITPTGLAAGAAVVLVGGLRVAITAHDLGAAVPAGLADELSRARRGADVLIATFHVTAPPSYLPTPVLEQAVGRALEAGAAVVAAHGTHMVGPVERRGHAVVIWGLGNLAFACDCTKETEGLLVEVELGPDGAGAAAVIPIQAGLAGAPAVPSPDANGIFDLLRALGTRFASVSAGRAQL